MQLPSRGWVALGSCVLATVAAPAGAVPFSSWTTVANSSDLAPGSATETFFSFNAPSVDANGTVVFRGRARTSAGGEEGGGGHAGGSGPPLRGVFSRDMSAPGQPINTIADNRTTLVPDPNNRGVTFTEFPAFPRVDTGGNVAFRGQSEPVWQYTLPDGSESRAGTSGVYGTAPGALSTGASQLGFLDEFDHFAVPGSAPPGTRFDQFPGAPSPTGDIVTFKGNWSDASGGRTGVYFRDMVADGGKSPVEMIAESGMAIPGFPGATFGSTAPPSASGGKVVFTGLDNEEAPTAGGIYAADLLPGAGFTPLVSLGAAVPDAPGQTFNRLGEALSFDGNRVAFWGAWGSDTRTVTLTCPTDGNAAVIGACLEQSGGTGETTREVPVHQGIFTASLDSGFVDLVAATGENGIEDFLFWNFSGRPPGVGFPGDDEGDDAEPPRWRSSPFFALEGDRTVFKATDYTTDWLALATDDAPIETLLALGMAASLVDPEAPEGSWITSLGLERDGQRGGRLAITAGFLNEAGESWAGVYVAPVPLPPAALALAAGLAMLGAAGRRRRA